MTDKPRPTLTFPAKSITMPEARPVATTSPTEPLQTVTTRIPATVYRRLKVLAAQDGTLVQNLIATAIQDLLNQRHPEG